MAKKIFLLSTLVIITSYFVYSSFDYFISSFNIESHDAGNRRLEERLQNLRVLIPIQNGIIGYFSNEHIESFEYDPDNANGEYILTQYALSPLILDKGKYHEWNILNMTPDAYEIWNNEHKLKFEVAGSGGGFYILHRIHE